MNRHFQVTVAGSVTPARLSGIAADHGVRRVVLLAPSTVFQVRRSAECSTSELARELSERGVVLLSSLLVGPERPVHFLESDSRMPADPAEA